MISMFTILPVMSPLEFNLDFKLNGNGYILKLPLQKKI